MQKRIKICHLSTLHSAYDTRILYKECISLSNAGYEVVLLAVADKKENYKGVNIIPLKKYNSRLLRIIVGAFRAFILCMKQKPEMVHFHDPELIWIAVLLRMFGKKVVFDVHEDLPVQVLHKEWIRWKFVRKMTSILVFLVYRYSCLFFCGIFAVTEEIKKKFPKRKTFLLRNFPILSYFPEFKLKDSDNDKLKIIYSGTLSKYRGIYEIVDVMAKMPENVELWLVGNFDDEKYFEKCKSLKGWQKVNYFGFLKTTEVYKLISKADIGIQLLYPLPNYLTALSVKVFEFMAMGKPVVLSQFPYYQELFADCALFALPQNQQSILDALNKLINDKELRIKLGNIGRNRVMKEFVWENEQNILVEFYNKQFKIKVLT